MRLDKYLKVSRLIKRRTVANEACDAGRILVNGKPARASLRSQGGGYPDHWTGSQAPDGQGSLGCGACPQG